MGNNRISMVHRESEGDEMSDAHECNWHEHEWREEYYGTRCRNCGVFYVHGQAPWDVDAGADYSEPMPDRDAGHDAEHDDWPHREELP